MLRPNHHFSAPRAVFGDVQTQWYTCLRAVCCIPMLQREDETETKYLTLAAPRENKR
jgi:hypothetical protein